VIEILFRVGGALLLSVSLALLLAWSWDRSDTLTAQAVTDSQMPSQSTSRH
jgi:hypothetical protein